MEEITITSLSEYINYVSKDEYDDSYTIYRGQTNDFNLLPRIFRNQIYGKEELINYENKLFTEFKIKGRAFLNYEPKTDFEWLAIAQHHGLNTRLLDWSENALAALWFCVRDKILDKNSFGVVWIFKPLDLSNYFIDESKDDDPFVLKFTKIYRPSYISKRIIAQSGVFTLHKYDLTKGKAIPLEKNKLFKDSLLKIKIHYNNFDKIKKDLINCGIHSATLFPDLDGLSELLNYITSNPQGINNLIQKLENLKNILKN